MIAHKVAAPHHAGEAIEPEQIAPNRPGRDTVQRYFGAFQAHDRAALEAMLTDDFTFSSPRDDRLDKAAFFERCWPNHRRIESFVLEKIFEQGNEAFVRYRARRAGGGGEFRNTEFMKLDGDRIQEIDVYFGRDL